MDSKTSTPPLRILVIDDEANIRMTLSMCLEVDGHKVVAHGNIHDAMEEVARQVFDLVFLDLRLGMDNGMDFLPRLTAESPWAKVVVITAFASIETAVEAMRRGAIDYLPKPFEPAQVQLVTKKVAERRQLELKVEALKNALGSLDAEADFPTDTPAMRQAVDLARQVARARAAILISGEQGVGKGRLARAIHTWSARADGPFAVVNCQQPVDALEAELFGISPEHSQAAGGGRVAFCEGGTLVLDEIGAMPVRLQNKVLRLVGAQEYERVDEARPRAADVRVVATSSTDLAKGVEAGTFRQDLLLALNVVEIQIPALRNRPDDIELLAERYLAFFSRDRQKPAVLSTDAMHIILKHSWPGNSRELRNVMERAVMLCEGGTIGVAHLPPNLLNSAPSFTIGDLVPLDSIEKMHILKVVASTRSLRRAAAVLEIDSGTLCRRMKRYEDEGGIPPASRDPESVDPPAAG
jgi:NtrC-family two-component system response regulator AlgB